MKTKQFQSIKTVLEVKKPVEILEKSLGPKEKFQKEFFERTANEWGEIANKVTMKKRSWTDFIKWLDVWLALLSEEELKVAFYIARQTIGYKKDWDSISCKQFREGQKTKDGVILNLGTGIKQDRTIYKAIKALIKIGALKVEHPKGAPLRLSFTYLRDIISYPQPLSSDSTPPCCSTAPPPAVQQQDINAYYTKQINQLAGQVKNKENQKAFYGGYPVILKGDRYFYEEDGISKEYHGSEKAFEWK